ncbi:alpha/beta-hydrolase [Crucibulum laeve]|uniref:Alpha/beta-hydrolase n=1 Tax=Crucibulum laeve TaxID=68775 RepID=A0A5C3M050_9AGAR|nr:alpha/beta-hydrolase [Crucibulum laeve]
MLLVISVVITGGIYLVISFHLRSSAQPSLDQFYSNITSLTGACTGVNNGSISHAGHIGLKGDTPEKPKRSFFWYFEAENNAKDAPVILSTGGGPGTSGLMNALSGQSPCIISENGTEPNPNRWTEHLNMIFLDHPIGAGYSYGTRVNNSHDAALDVYDFLQKFFRIYPHLSRNKFILAGGSYGGIYIPNTASVIHRENNAIAAGTGLPGTIPINLESMMVSNPFTDPLAHFSWLLQYRCVEKNVYNSSTCTELYSVLPTCLESIRIAYAIPSIENRVEARSLCSKRLGTASTHGTVLEDVRRHCDDPSNVEVCHPLFSWMGKFFNNAGTKQALGIPPHVNFTALSPEVFQEFAGDMIQQHQLLYEPLLKDGIRLLHYVGAQDANCAWPGVFSFLKSLRSPYQKQFLETPDLPSPSLPNVTFRVVGGGAGNMTFALVADAGHFVVKDQPVLVKSIVEHWVFNQSFFEDMA